MAEELQNTPEDLLPLRQRVAWMAAIWLLSMGLMVLVSMALRAWLT